MNFWQSLLLAAVGPLTAAVVGTLIIGLFVSSIAQRTQDQRSQENIKHELVRQMTLTANELYFAILHYRNAKEDNLPLESIRNTMDEQYRIGRSTGYALESQLRSYFPDPVPGGECPNKGEPERLWHATIDTLAVQYYKVLDKAGPTLLSKNAGPCHTGVDIEDLNKVTLEKLGEHFRNKLKDATNAVTTSDMRSIKTTKKGGRFHR